MSSRRPGRARHSRESIAQAAIGIADAEGFEALSMRRVAKELGAGTMTLYHYVVTKDELLALVDDAIMGEIVVPDDELPDGWRDGLREIAHRTKNAFIAHPWTIDMPDSSDGGPNSIRHFEQSLAVMAKTNLPREQCHELILLVDDYVFGYVRRFISVQAAVAGDAARIAEEHSEAIAERVQELDPEAFPYIHALFTEGDPREQLTKLMELGLDPARFDRGLDLLLDGIERRTQHEPANGRAKGRRR
ncbi:MAG: TetR/AcrR family transcriptional regulator [Gaiellaceae bacterium]